MKNTWKFIQEDILACWIAATVAVCSGLAWNSLRAEPLPLTYMPKEERMQAAVERLQIADVSGPEVPNVGENAVMEVPEYVSLEEFRVMAEGDDVVVLDARPEIFHRLGRVPGAVSLPREDFEATYPQVRELLANGRPLVIYCASASCEDSALLKSALVKLGHSGISIFKGGWAEWKQAGLPEEVSR